MKSILVIAVFVLGATCARCQGIKNLSKLSGKWVVNMSLSEFGGAPSFTAPKIFDIRQKVDSVSITRINVDTYSNKETSTTEVVSLDGKPNPILLSGNRSKESAITLEDYKRLREISTYFILGNPRSISHIITLEFKLSEDENRLTVNIFTQNNGTNYSVKAVYDRDK